MEAVASRNRSLEQQVNAASHQTALDKEIFQQEMKALQNNYDALIMSKDHQIVALQQRASEGQQMTAAQVAAAKAKLEETEQALLDHKSKRLTARTEMIQLAESLEKCQDVNRTMDYALQSTLLPMASEQVCVLSEFLRCCCVQ